MICSAESAPRPGTYAKRTTAYSCSFSATPKFLL
jgi:hypothetical protein